MHNLWDNFREEVERLLDLLDTAFHVGDGGFGFYPRRSYMEKLIKQNEWLKKRNCVMHNIRGNHDNPNWFLPKYKMIEFFGGEDKKVPAYIKEDMYYLVDYVSPIEYTEFITTLSNIKFVPDYAVVHEGGHNILCIGGAITIDRIMRKMGRDYFPNEILVHKPAVLKKIRGVNIVVTHTIPDFIPPFNQDSELIRNFAVHDKRLTDELIEERQIMTRIYNDIVANNTIDYWFYGHFHHWNNTYYKTTQFLSLPPNKAYELKNEL